MNFILLTAVLSAANSGIFATSRTLFSLAEKGEAPVILKTTTNSGVPIFAVLLNGVFLLIGAFLAFLAPGKIIGYMMTIPGFTVILLWLSICCAQLKLRPTYTMIPSFKVKLFPIITIVGIVGLLIIFIGSTFSNGISVGTVICFTTLALLIVLAFIKGKSLKKNEGTEEQAS
jgi:AAT family amino acid transporter